jgi:hypothetical protein
MGKAKEIIVKVLPSKIANDFVKKYHYSGKVVQNSSLHFGAFLGGRLHGVMSFGSPLDKRKVLSLVSGTKWNDMLELNRMAFDDFLPKNSESRCIAVAIRLIKKNAPNIKWILSFSDGTQCGDGTIYRASGFVLTQVKKNKTIVKLQSGEIVAKHGTSKRNFSNSKLLFGFQLQYIYLIDKKCTIQAEVLPFSKIDELGARMYKGEKQTASEV